MAAKKAPKKAAKKHAKKHDGKHNGGRDMRRAYEHLGRLEALQGGLPETVVPQIVTVTEMAKAALAGGDMKTSAELLRACEHIAFGALAQTGKDAGVGEALLEAIDTEYEHLIEKAAERWDEHDEEPGGDIAAIYEQTFADAEIAYRKGAFRRALELARAADALAHAGGVREKLLESVAKSPKKLRK